MNRIKQIPKWVYTGSLPAFYDTESATAIEQTARLHGYIRDLIEDYNKFISEINTYINDFSESTNKNQEDFENQIVKITHEFIHSVDEKVDNAINFMKTNINESLVNIVNEMLATGEITIETVYNDSTESLNIVVTEGSES